MLLERIKEWFFCIAMFIMPLAGCIVSWYISFPLWFSIIITVVVVVYYSFFAWLIYCAMNHDLSSEDCYGLYDPFN